VAASEASACAAALVGGVAPTTMAMASTRASIAARRRSSSASVAKAGDGPGADGGRDEIARGNGAGRGADRKEPDLLVVVGSIMIPGGAAGVNLRRPVVVWVGVCGDGGVDRGMRQAHADQHEDDRADREGRTQ
jgi:hypothetical protein